jgi:hypothetical protein
VLVSPCRTSESVDVVPGGFHPDWRKDAAKFAKAIWLPLCLRQTGAFFFSLPLPYAQGEVSIPVDHHHQTTTTPGVAILYRPSTPYAAIVVEQRKESSCQDIFALACLPSMIETQDSVPPNGRRPPA